MIYTPEMQAAVKTVKMPHDLPVDIIGYEMHPPFIGLRFYESHWRYLTDKERLDCIEALIKIKQIIEAFGVNVTIDPVYDGPAGSQVLG